MSVNLIEHFQSTISDVLVRQTSSLLGESAESTSSAVSKIFPALLNAILIKGSTDEGSRDLLQFINTHQVDESIIPAMLSGEPDTERLTTQGSDILKYLLGDKMSYMVDWVASGNGLKTSSANTLLKMIAPLAIAAIGRAIKEKSLNANGLKNLLAEQQVFVDASAPAAISELLGVTPATPAPPEKIASGVLEGNFNQPTAKEGSTMSKLLPWIVLLIAALGLFYFLDKSSNPSPADIEKKKQDSIENVRKMDSLRQATITDSLRTATIQDSIRNAATRDSLNAVLKDSIGN